MIHSDLSKTMLKTFSTFPQVIKHKIEFESILSFILPGEHDQARSVQDDFEDFVNCSTGNKTQNLRAFYLLSIQENIVNPELSKTTSTTLSTSPQVIRNGI